MAQSLMIQCLMNWVLNFEDEMVRSTDISKAEDLTKSKTVSDMKREVNRMKETEFRQTLKRHKSDIQKLWTQKPPKLFSFVKQQAENKKADNEKQINGKKYLKSGTHIL